MSKKQQYIYQGKTFIPDDDIELCNCECTANPLDLFAEPEFTKLFVTAERTFYLLIRKGDLDAGRVKTRVSVIPEDEAVEFLNENPDCISLENYSKIFGKPKRA